MKISTFYKVAIICVLNLLSFAASAQKVHPKFAQIHARYYQRYPKTISFIQQTELLRADTVYRRQTWYEAGLFPNLFRIDFGHPKDGNSVIFHGDSTYNFRNGKQLKPSINPNILIYLLGGMYFEPLQKVQEKLNKDGFDIGKSYLTNWEGKPVVVFGVSEADSTKSQLWFDARELFLVKLIQQRENSTLACHFQRHEKTGGVWHETFVKIFSNGKLVQTEAYGNFKTNVVLEPSFFDPNAYGKWHWFKD